MSVLPKWLGHALLTATLCFVCTARAMGDCTEKFGQLTNAIAYINSRKVGHVIDQARVAGYKYMALMGEENVRKNTISVRVLVMNPAASGKMNKPDP